MPVGSTNPVFRPPQFKRGTRIFLGSLLSLLAVGGAAFGAAAILLPRTLSYAVHDQKLIVTKGLTIRPSERVIPLKKIIEVRAVQLQRGKRKAGTAMPGYCAGRFSFPTLGSVDLASDCRRNAVTLQLKDSPRPLVLTPGTRNVFLSALAGEGRYEEIFHPGADTSLSWKVLKTIFALIILPALVIPVIFFVSPGRLRYQVHQESIEIHTLLGVRRFSIGNCFAQPYSPKSSMKTLGSSLPGYHAGKFRVDGMSTRVYATDLTEGVLIEGPDLRLFLNPEDPEAFLQALRSLGNIEVHQS